MMVRKREKLTIGLVFTFVVLVVYFYRSDIELSWTGYPFAANHDYWNIDLNEEPLCAPSIPLSTHHEANHDYWNIDLKEEPPPSIPLSTHHKGPQMHGFVMALDYSDQMTGSSANLMNLQCFIGRHVKGVKVVEPFLHPEGSLFGVSLSHSYAMSKGYKLGEINSVKLSDVLDIDNWQYLAQARGYSSLFSWSYFTKNCPNNLVLVYHRWIAEVNCSMMNMMMNATKEFILTNNFKEIRKVCFDFRKTGALSPQEFVDSIYGPFNPRETVVVFNKWGGIASNVQDYRFSVNGTLCRRVSELSLYPRSKQILEDAKTYSKRYMNQSEKYIAVMVRLEYFARHHKFYHLSPESQRNQLNRCFNQIHQKVTALKKERSVSSTLLTMDVGKYGSLYFRLKEYSEFGIANVSVINKAAHDFINWFFNNAMTQDIWEESFEKVAKFHIPGYIALMQQELAANSMCLILAGGGAFQDNAEELYHKLHSSSPKCVFRICK